MTEKHIASTAGFLPKGVFALWLLLLLPYLILINDVQAEGDDSLHAFVASLPDSIKLSAMVQFAGGDTLFHRNADRVIPSASVIKIPIMAVFLSKVDAGLLSPHTKVQLGPNDIVGGAGDIQKNYPDGGTFTLGFLAREMMRMSDNTATNAVIRAIGMGSVNRFSDSLMLPATRLNRYMMDFDAVSRGHQNYTTPAEMNRLLGLLLNGKILSEVSRQQLMSVMLICDDRTMIPAQLPSHLPVANKTGALQYVRTDSGIIFGDEPLILTVFVEGFNSYEQAEDIAAEFSRLAWEVSLRQER